MRKVLATTAAVLFSLMGFAQFREPVDTIFTPDSAARIIIMSDKTWEYESDLQDKDTVSIDWVQNALVPYQVPLNQIPDTVYLNMKDSMGIFCCPFVGPASSRYGYRRGRRHTGIDIPFHTGTPVYAAFDGIVTRSGYIGGYGNLIVVRHYNGLETYYGHLSRRDVVAGDWVTAGQMVGFGGSTGHSTGPHLHFETRYKGYPFDPERVIEFSSGRLREEVFALAKSYFGAGSRFGIDDRLKIDSLAAASVPPKPKTIYHTVKSGENLSVIAKKYHTTVGQICSLNKMSSKKLIKPGQRLRVK